VASKTVKEFLGVTGVVASLIFVGVEIRQNTVAARAAAYQAMGEGISEVWAQIGQDPELALLTLRFFREEDAEFTPREEAMLIAFNVAALRREETMWRQAELGLIEPEVIGYLGNDSPMWPSTSTNSAKLWPTVARLMSPDFLEYLEEERGYPASAP
jgi:hypothetical protein